MAFLHSTRRGLRLGLFLLQVKVYEGIDEELVDNEPERGTGERGAKGPSHLAKSGVLCRVVDHGEGSAGGVSGKESIVWHGTAAVSAGDDATGTRINEPPKEGMSWTHDVVSGVFMKYRSEQRIAEDTI